MMGDDSVGAISLAFDSSTHREQAFFDLRVRMCFQGVLFNLHLVAIPMFERHTAMNMFNMLVKFRDALYHPWRAKLIGTSSDGENTMTGRHGELVTRIVAGRREQFTSRVVRAASDRHRRQVLGRCHQRRHLN
jgi:hypothetical protein